MGPQGLPRQMDPLDSIIILLIAITLALFILWLAGPVAHNPTTLQLPGFIQKTYSSIWSYITGAGLSGLLAYFRSRTTPRPNYLVWSLGTAVLLLMLAFGVAFAGTAHGPPIPNLATLKMWVKFDKREPPPLSFLQKNPHFREARFLAPDPLDGHYQELVDWPAAEGDELEVAAVQIAKTSELVNGPDKSIQICLIANLAPPKNGSPFEVDLLCAVGAPCSFAPTDFGWASECPKKTGESRSFFSLVTKANAQGFQGGENKPGWRIPSLSTLEKMPDNERTGYTRFTLKSDSLSGVEKADSFRYKILANGSPLYVDGWSAADMLKEFSATKGLDFSFGLENLSFSGADQGCENIEVALEFLNGNEPIKKVQVTRRYAALRDAAMEEITEGDHTTFTWTGTYVKPKNEDRSEVFILSTTSVAEASGIQSRISQAHLSFNGMDVVGVLRPPLNTPQYGIVIGLRQPTGQVKFTFDPIYAKQLLAWAKEVHTSNAKVLRYLPFIYQMKIGESGVGKMASCGTKAPQA